jgi:hypothetical protein
VQTPEEGSEVAVGMGDSEAVEGVCMRVSMDQSQARVREDIPSLRGRLSGPDMVWVMDMR